MAVDLFLTGTPDQNAHARVLEAMGLLRKLVQNAKAMMGALRIPIKDPVEEADPVEDEADPATEPRDSLGQLDGTWRRSSPRRSLMGWTWTGSASS